MDARVVDLSFILLTAVSVALLFFFLHSGKQKEFRRLVAETSLRYTMLCELNNQYRFQRLSPLHYTKHVSSKHQFDQCNLRAFFLEVLETNKSSIEKHLQTAAYNKLLYEKYKAGIVHLPPLTTPKQAKELLIPFKHYERIERELCDQHTQWPNVDVKIICTVEYTSPQGRRSYHDEMAFSAGDIQQGFKELAQRSARKATQDYQRSSMTKKLRYEILKRDHFRCTLCGRSQADGAVLEVDHIKPVSKGGLTEPDNLRTLCMECNRGKRDAYDEYGMN